MILERPAIHGQGTLEQRVTSLERYMYRLVQELEEILVQLEGEEDHEL